MNNNTSFVGRPPKYKTEAARKSAKKKQDAAAAKRMQERRVERYNSDPEYRVKVLAQQRKRYRKSSSGTVTKFGSRHGKATEFATRRKVKVNGKWSQRLTLTAFEFGEFIGASEKAITSWIATSKLPRPNLRSEEGDAVYNHRQANAMAKAIHETHVGRAIFRSTDTDVIRAVHTASLSEQL